MTTDSGKKVRLHFMKSGVVNEAKALDSGKTHTPAEFKADRAASARKADQPPKPMNSRFLANHGVAPANRPSRG